MLNLSPLKTILQLPLILVTFLPRLCFIQLGEIVMWYMWMNSVLNITLKSYNMRYTVDPLYPPGICSRTHTPRRYQIHGCLSLEFQDSALQSFLWRHSGPSGGHAHSQPTPYLLRRPPGPGHDRKLFWSYPRVITSGVNCGPRRASECLLEVASGHVLETFWSLQCIPWFFRTLWKGRKRPYDPRSCNLFLLN